MLSLHLITYIVGNIIDIVLSESIKENRENYWVLRYGRTEDYLDYFGDEGMAIHILDQTTESES